MLNFGPLTAEIGSGVWGTLTNFNGFRVLASLVQRRRLTEVHQTLDDVRPSPGLVHYRGLLLPDGILTGAKFTLRPSLAFFYIGSVTVRHSSSGRQPKFAACYTSNGIAELLQRVPYLYSAGRPSRWASAHILVAFERNSQWKFFSKRYGV